MLEELQGHSVRWLATGVMVLGVVYCALLIGVFFLQRALLFPRPRESRMPTDSRMLLRIPGPNQSTVFGLYSPALPGRSTVVHFHGNAEQLADQEEIVAAAKEHGLGCLAVEYPGYGLGSTQNLSETAIFAAAEAALRYLVDSLGVGREHVVLEGRSLGTAVAVEMAARGFGSRLVLISPFTSVADLGARIFPFLPVRFLVRDRFDSASRAPQIRVPVLIVHGAQDEVIPFEMGQRLARLFPNATLEVVEGAGHNDVLAGPNAKFFEGICRFANLPNAP